MRKSEEKVSNTVLKGSGTYRRRTNHVVSRKACENTTPGKDNRSQTVNDMSTVLSEKQSPTRTKNSSPPGDQSMPVHIVHTHPHRRHYPHHLLDHFSGDLTHQPSTSATWKDIVENQESGAIDMRTQAEQTDAGGLHAAGVRPRATKVDIPREGSCASAVSGIKKQLEQKISPDKPYSDFREPQQWPFFGTESRVLPSGRRVSFLRQACIGFSLTTTKEKDQRDNMQAVCPRAFREASFVTPRRSLLRSGANVAELRRKFTSLSESPTKQPVGQNYADLANFKYESVKGPHESLHAQAGAEEEQNMKQCSAIIDSSSTKGRHPVPRAPGLKSPCTPTSMLKGKAAKTPPVQQKLQSKQLIKRSPTKPSSPSPTRRKESPPSWRTPSTERTIAPSSVTKLGAKGPKIVVPKTDGSQNRKLKPVTETATSKVCRPLAAPPTPVKRTKRLKLSRVVTEKQKDEYSSPSSDSFGDGSSLVVIEADEDVTSTFEELSADASDLSDRNFLIDYGDPSRFYFRNEWDARMRELDETTNIMRQKVSKFCTDDEMYEGTVNIIAEVEKVKTEVGELYDYFDHFEREEDTLLQQVQRQLTQANRYCKILHYRLEKAERQRVDDNRVQELEEELKLSRQVAVSLHWELQAADSKQAKLEKENISLRRRLLAAETSREALSAQVAKLQNIIDQMSLHAPSQAVSTDNSDGTTTSDSKSEIKRQIQFMEEKENVMISRLVDLQREKDSLNDELEQYRDQYGELATVPASGANRHTDLKLRLKLAEDQAGLLARKVIELQLENDNMGKLAAEKELMAKEAMKRHPSVSDLQFLEDERESLRLALDEMEIENQKLAAELLRYKQAVHRQLHSSSISTESPLVDVGVMLRVPRSNDSVFDDEKTSRSHKSEDRSSRHDTISEHVGGDRKKLRPLSLTSPLNQPPKRMSISRTLSDIAIPLSPDTKSQSVQITPTISSNTQGPKSTTATNGSRKSYCHKCKRTKKVKMIDVSIETEVEKPIKLLQKATKSISTSTKDQVSTPMKSQATSPIITNLQNLFQPVLDVATQIRERKKSMKSEATSPVRAPTPSPSSLAYSLPHSVRLKARPHNALLDEMRKQLANVRNIAESMDTVVNVEEIDAELERKGRELVKAEYKKVREGTVQKKKISKLAKSLQKYIRDMEDSVADESERSETLDGALGDVAGWNLHGNTEVLPNHEAGSSDTSTLTLSCSSTDDVLSVQTVRHLAARIRSQPIGELSTKALEGIVMLIIAYVMLTSLPGSALVQICFLLLVFFIC